jgi:hypothetical protein
VHCDSPNLDDKGLLLCIIFPFDLASHAWFKVYLEYQWLPLSVTIDSYRFMSIIMHVGYIIIYIPNRGH